MFLSPYRVKDYQPNWCSFSWFLGWAINTFTATDCRYLEWGPGWSTDYVLSSGLAERNIFSVESEKEWFDKYKALNVNLVLRDGPKTEAVSEIVDRGWYDPFPGQVFDVILVDGGHKRDECVLQAAAMLSPSGFVIVHDTLTNAAHRRASLGAALRVVAENLIPPGTTLLSHRDRRLSARERAHLTFVNRLAVIAYRSSSVLCGLSARLKRVI